MLISRDNMGHWVAFRTILMAIYLAIACLFGLVLSSAEFSANFTRRVSPELPGSIPALKRVQEACTCPCEDPTLCQIVKTVRAKEIFIFSVSTHNWQNYDWDHVTTIVMFNYYDPKLMCYAHSRGVRVVSLGNFDFELLTNATARVEWVMHKVNEAIDHHLDGTNLDIEFAVAAKDAHLLTSLVQMTTKAFRDSIPGSQVTFDVPWSADCIDGRCYDMKAIADAVDFVFVMAYDEQSQIFGDCIAMANAPLNKTQQGVESFLKLGIPASKMILGVPWYGYDYPCLELSLTDVCSIREHPFRGVNCSDAAGKQKNYGTIVKLLATNSTGRKWNKEYQAPYFTYKDTETKQIMQVWYDDPESLQLRYDFAKKQCLRGVGPWNADTLDYSDDPLAKNQTKAMWDAMVSFLTPSSPFI